MGQNCFRSCCGLANVTFSSDSHLIEICDWAFWGCDSLTSLSLPASLKWIGKFCFRGCLTLATVTFPPDSALVRIEVFAFYRCVSLESFCLPSSVEFVGQDCFAGCHSLSDFALALPSRVRILMDFPGKVSEVPDSVQQLAACIGYPRQMLNFGQESRLNVITVYRDKSEADNRCFLRFSTWTLKILRLRSEF
jgi:hypothetical protein